MKEREGRGHKREERRGRVVGFDTECYLGLLLYSAR